MLKKPHLFFFSFIPLLFTLQLIIKEKSLALFYFGGRFEIDFSNLSLIAIGYFLLIGCNYLALKWMNKKTIKWLTNFHVFFQLVSIILIIYLFLNNEALFQNGTSNFVLMIAFLLFLISFFFHFLNFIISIFLKR